MEPNPDELGLRARRAEPVFVRDVLEPRYPARDAVARRELHDDPSDPQPLIHRCAAAGWVEGVDQCLRRGDSVDARGMRGWSPLHVAVAFDRRDVVDLLIDAGADRTLRDDYGCSVRWVGLSCGRDPELDERLATLGMVVGRSALGNEEMSRLGTPRHSLVYLARDAGLRALTKLALAVGSSARDLKPLFENGEALATVDVFQIRRIAASASKGGFGIGWSGQPDPLLDTRCARSANVYFYEGETTPLTQRMLTPYWPPDWMGPDRPESFDGGVPK